MTANQLKYWENKETVRANLAREQENTRHNRVAEAVTANQLVETKRHNKVTEQQSGQKINYDYALGQSTLAENKRHNQATEATNLLNVSASYANVAERAKERQEQTRHNKMQEAIDIQNVESNAFSRIGGVITNLLGVGLDIGRSLR